MAVLTLVVRVAATLAQYRLARRWALRMPERMKTPIGFTGPDAWMPWARGLRIGRMLATGITVVCVALAVLTLRKPGVLDAMEAATPLTVLADRRFLYGVNASGSRAG